MIILSGAERTRVPTLPASQDSRAVSHVRSRLENMV